MNFNEILYGVAYYDEYMPYDRIETDFKMIRDAGMNVIRIAESTWSTWEPEEGVFDFTHLHRMLDCAAKYELKVIVGTPTYAIPSWLAKKYPDILAVTHNGKELYGHRQNMDITNPDYLHTKTAISFLNYQLKVSILCFHQGLSAQVFRLHIPDIRFTTKLCWELVFHAIFLISFRLAFSSIITQLTLQLQISITERFFLR